MLHFRHALRNATAFRFAESWLALTFYTACVRWAPYRLWQHHILAATQEPVSKCLFVRPSHNQLYAFRRAVNSQLIGSTCLSRSLALVRVLRASSIPARLKIGVQKDEGRVEAHAWVDVNDCVIAEDSKAVAKFIPFPATEGTH